MLTVCSVASRRIYLGLYSTEDAADDGIRLFNKGECHVGLGAARRGVAQRHNLTDLGVRQPPSPESRPPTLIPHSAGCGGGGRGSASGGECRVCQRVLKGLPGAAGGWAVGDACRCCFARLMLLAR